MQNNLSYNTNSLTPGLYSNNSPNHKFPASTALKSQHVSSSNTPIRNIESFHESINKNLLIPTDGKIRNTKMLTKKYPSVATPNILGGDVNKGELSEIRDIHSASRDEFSQQIETSKLEILDSLKKLQRHHEKSNSKDVLEQLIDLKGNIKNNLGKSNRIRQDTNRDFIQDMNNIKNSITKIIVEESTKNKNDINSFRNIIYNFKDDLHSRMNELEKNQKLQLLQIKEIMNKSEDERIRNLAQKFAINNHKEYANFRNMYVKPTRKEIKEVIQDNLLDCDIDRRNSESEEIFRLIERNKKVNKTIKQDMLKEDSKVINVLKKN
jgi:hypothetical protein